MLAAAGFGEVAAGEELQPEIERLEQWAREYGRTARENLARWFGGPDNSNCDTTANSN